MGKYFGHTTFGDVVRLLYYCKNKNVMKKIIFSLIISATAFITSAQCNGEFSLSGAQSFQKFTNGAQIQLTYCGEKSNLHTIMSNANAYRDNLKLEIENDAKNEQLYNILLTIKEDNSGQYAMKSLIAIGINAFYYEGKKINTEKAESIFK
jgi:hypothetical protein